MKNLIKILMFSIILIVISSSNLLSQCFCDAVLAPVSDCTAELRIKFSPACQTAGLTYNQITLNTNSFSPFTGKMLDANFTYGGLTYSLNSTDDLITISSINNLVNTATTSNYVSLGTINFYATNQSIVTSEFIASGPGSPNSSLFLESPVGCPISIPWQKIYGNFNTTDVHRIKANNNGVYIIHNVVEQQGLPAFPAVSKFDIQTGALMWKQYYDIDGQLVDLEFGINEVFVIGTTNQPNDFGVILKLNDNNGNIVNQRVMDIPGRNFFHKIVRHENPLNSNFPYYILGRKNPANMINSNFDLGLVFNMDNNLNFNWIQEYELGTTEIEAYRGLIQLQSGNLIILGNGSIANEGVLIEIDGSNGNIVLDQYFFDSLDFYDGIELSNGKIAIVGHQFASNEAVVLILGDNSTQYNIEIGAIFNDISGFRQIGIDRFDNIYTIGSLKGAQPQYSIINKFNSNGTSLGINLQKYIDNGELDIANPNIYVSPYHDGIFVVDDRLNVTNGFGMRDMVLTSSDLQLSESCATDKSPSVNPYGVNQGPINMISNNVGPFPFIATVMESGFDYFCQTYCQPIPTCDFIFTDTCLNVQFNEVLSNIPSGASISWDFNGDLIPDSNGNNPNHTYPSYSNWLVTMIVTASDGTQICSISKTVSLVPNLPTITCPVDITINMDPNLCTATYLPSPIVSDPCDTTLNVLWFLSGATSSTPTSGQVVLNPGTTTINCLVNNSNSQSANCTYNVTVIDSQNPILSNCPTDINANSTLCAGGANVNFTLPTVIDNCPNALITCSHQSGQFFSCGTTTVTCTATDTSGNTSSCSFNVTVTCPCTEVISSTLECTNVDDEYSFSIDFLPLIGANPNNCIVNAIVNQANVTLLNQNFSVSGGVVTLHGTLQIVGTPVPTSINIGIMLDCVCPNGNQTTCTTNINLNVPCCKEINIDNLEICRGTGTIQIPLIGCNNLYDVRRVNWYVADAPCPAIGSFGTPLQQTNNCSDLLLEPRWHSGDICVYAEVIMGNGAGPCTILTSNVSTITQCEPVSCQTNSQEFCYMGTPIQAAPLTANINPSNPNCVFDVEWYDNNNTLVSTALTYTPPPLSMAFGSQACSESFTYRCDIITQHCGTQSCTSTITLHNNDAPLGNLYLDPTESMPFCPGEDAALTYDKACAGQPAEWDWFLSHDNFVSHNVPLPENGTMNSRYMTNRLYQDTWIRVEKQNGTCPVDQIDFFIDLVDPLTISALIASPSPLCDPTSVQLDINILTPNYSSSSNCDFTIIWYRNGVAIHTDVQNQAAGTHTYSGPIIPGNYQVVVLDNCCPSQSVWSNIISIEPPMEVVIAGPCFRCECESFTLQALVDYEYTGCSYQWYQNGIALTGETSKTLNLNSVSHPYTAPFINYSFEITCPNGCSDLVQYNLRQCGDCTTPIDEISQQLDGRLYPNPNDGQATLEFSEALPQFSNIFIYNVHGQVVQYISAKHQSTQFEIQTEDNPSGLYYIIVEQKGEILFQQKFVKE